MSRPSRLPERRGPDRPLVGDTAPCSRCAAGMLEFTERYRMAMAADEQVERIPAWVCDECPHVVFVRAEHQPAALRATARRARAAATRRLMTARTVRVRADGVLRKSMSRKKRR